MSWIEARELISFLYLDGLSPLKYPWVVKFVVYFLFTGIRETERELTTVCFNLWGVCWGVAYPYLLVIKYLFSWGIWGDLFGWSGRVWWLRSVETALWITEGVVRKILCPLQDDGNLCLGSAAKVFAKIRPLFFQEEAHVEADASWTKGLLIAFGYISDNMIVQTAHTVQPVITKSGAESQEIWCKMIKQLFLFLVGKTVVTLEQIQLTGNIVEEGVCRKDDCAQAKLDKPCKAKS